MNSSLSSQPAGNGASAQNKTGMMDGAAKVFREFKWGLLTLFLLMVVVIGLVYDGGKKKAAEKEKAAAAPAAPKTEAAPNLPADENSFSFGLESRPPEPSRTQPSATLTQDRASADTLNPTQPRNSTSDYSPWLQTQPSTLPAIPSKPPVLPQTPVTTKPAAPGTPVTPVPPAKGGNATLYTVQPGDTLSGIAGRHYPGKPQRGIKAIAEANKSTLPDIHLLRPGMKLKIPALAEQPASAAGANTASTSNPVKPADAKVAATATSGEYTVQAGDTLERIARKQLNNAQRWNEIFELNRDRIGDPARLQIGQKLRMPASKGASAETKDASPKQEPQQEQDSAVAQKEPAEKRAPASTQVHWMP